MKDLLWELEAKKHTARQGRFEYLEWIALNLAEISDEFIRKNGLLGSYFIKNMNKNFQTSRFELLLKRWLIEYFLRLFSRFDNIAGAGIEPDKELTLEDNPVNRFGVERYLSVFKASLNIKWEKRAGITAGISGILLQGLSTLYLALDRGLKISPARTKYKVMREAVWGLYDTGGYRFHDDFLVDGQTIGEKDLLLYSRGIPAESGRLKGYQDARKSPYAHFNLLSLSLGLKPLFSRIIPKYIVSSARILFREILSENFSLYCSIYLYYVNNAMLYEKVFSHFEVISEIGHNYFSASHVAEAIVCQNHGTRYYLMHWSDISAGSCNKYLLSFLGCDKFLLWGNAHTEGIKGDPQIFMPTGYLFKKFVREAMSDRDRLLSDMGIKAGGKIIAFFEESFGGECTMTEDILILFWETIFKIAANVNGATVLIKPKGTGKYDSLSPGSRERFFEVKSKVEKMPNVYIVDSNRWSFIEVIGVSDIVITQGMSSSATIAIICGIEGLFLYQAKDAEDHPFVRMFNDKIVFSDSDKLLAAVNRILEGGTSSLKDIPESILREYDAYDDDLGIERFRRILTEQKT